MSNACLNHAEIDDVLQGFPHWQHCQVEGDLDAIQQQFSFADFAAAMSFATQIAAAAEQADHHPRMIVEWGKLQLLWWSHSAGGVTTADVAMAKQAQQLFDAGVA